MEQYERHVIVDPSFMMGKPLLKGIRITVEHVLKMLAAGESIDDMVVAHSVLVGGMVLAGLGYARGFSA